MQSQLIQSHKSEEWVKKGRKQQHLPNSCLQTATECRNNRYKSNVFGQLWLSSAIDIDCLLTFQVFFYINKSEEWFNLHSECISMHHKNARKSTKGASSTFWKLWSYSSNVEQLNCGRGKVTDTVRAKVDTVVSKNPG